ncbi:UNVERIFIED_CONTAM: protein CHUP1, chloroplastic, partial [Sesamum calycinum]
LACPAVFVWNLCLKYEVWRLGFLVAASIAAYAVKQINVKSPRPDESLKNDEESFEKSGNEGEDKEHVTYSDNGLKEVVAEEEEEKEEVKLINSIINPALSSTSDFEDELLPEFESLLSGEIDFPLPSDKYEAAANIKAEKDKVYESEMANNASELERLRNLVKELEEREVKLEGELLEYYGLKEQESSIVELQKQLKIKTVEIDMLNITINSLQAERKKLQDEVSQGVVARKELETARKKIKELQRQIQLEASQTKGQLLLLKQQVSGLQAKEEEALKKDSEVDKKLKVVKELEVETEMVAKVREEVNELRHTNEDLVKQVEGLQMNRFSEVEELVYLRWVNACLRFELRNYQTPSGKISARDLSKSLSPRSQEKAKQLIEDFDNTSIDSSTSRFSSLSKKPSLMQKLKRWGKSKDDSSALSSPARSLAGGSPSRASMSLRPRGPLEALMLRNVGDSVAITSFGTAEQDEFNSPETPKLPPTRVQDSSPDTLNSVASSFHLMNKSVEGVLDEKYPAYKDRHKLALEREKHIKEKAQQARAVRFGDPLKGDVKSISLPPKLALIKEKPIVSGDSTDQSNGNRVESPVVSKMQLAQIEKRAPRVPRPPPKSSGGAPAGANTNAPSSAPGAPPAPPPHQSLMKREAKKDTSSLISTSSNASDARSNMIGEIENRSSFLLAVKADVETQGDFVQSLATEVRAASFTNIEDLVAFVNWLDEELSFLVDERAVLKHFDWPEGKADALREAAFEYQDLMKLEKQVSSFNDDPNLPCEAALKKMYKLLEKVEQSVYALLRTRDMAVSRYKEFGIPVDWLLDSGVVGKIKLSSVQLARKYMKRVASELDAMTEPEKEPNKEFLILQGVRFAFRVHQFAGGFDAESMKAFEELRSRAHAQTTEENKAEAS